MVKQIGKFIIRQANLVDADNLLALLNHQYNNKFNLEYIYWQYFSNENNKVVCIEIEGSIIAMFGVLRKFLNNGLIGLQASDMLIKEGYRGNDLFVNMANYAFNLYEKKDFLFVLPNANGRRAIEKNLNWQTIFRINEWQLDSGKFNENAKIIEDTKLKTHLSFLYTAETINWRFIESPLYEYKKIGLSENRYAYVKNYCDPNNGKLSIDIVYFSSQNINVVDLVKLINEIIKDSSSDFVITTWALPNTKIAKTLQSLGFEEIIKERYFCLRLCTEIEINDFNSQEWHVNQSDTEFY